MSIPATRVVWVLWSGAILAAARPLEGQVPVAPDSLRQAIRALSARLDSLEAGRCPLGAAPNLPGGADSAAAALRELGARLEQVIAAHCARAPSAPGRDTAAADDLAALRAAARAAAGEAGAPPDTTARPQEFVSRQRNLSALNPEISVTGDARLIAREGRQRDNAQVREFEFAFQSALDPYSHTKIFVTFEQDEIAIEEGYVYWTGLPGRLRADVGKFRQPVGDLNRWHLHALPESEYPLVYRRFLSAEGLTGIGLSLYTALPVSFFGATHELWVQGVSAESDGLLAGSRQPALLGRLQNFRQFTRSTYGQLGVTVAGGNNADSAFTGRLFGLDARLTWRPPEAATRREFTLRAEGYLLRSTLSGSATHRTGGFVDATFRAGRRWVVATRYDWVQSPRGTPDTEWAIVPSLTWWQSEFVYLRLEGQHRRSERRGERNLVLLQAVWAMGPHKHETY